MVIWRAADCREIHRDLDVSARRAHRIRCDMLLPGQHSSRSSRTRPGSQARATALRSRNPPVQRDHFYRDDQVDTRRLDDKFSLQPQNRFSSWVAHAKHDRSSNSPKCNMPQEQRKRVASSNQPRNFNVNSAGAFARTLQLHIAANSLAVFEGELAARQSDCWRATRWQSWPRAQARLKG